MIRYLSGLTKGKMVLWCYLIWYALTVCFYFDPAVSIWLNSMGISVVIGIALMLSVSLPAGSKKDPWQTFRLFMMPFAVSSFSSLIKGKGYIFIIPPRLVEQCVSIGACVMFIALVCWVKRRTGRWM